MHTRIFVDFWNLQLGIRNVVGAGYRLDWTKLSPLLMHESATLLQDSLSFDGTNVYISYDPRSQKGTNLRGWANNTLDRFPGIRVIIKERKRKGCPSCPSCHREVGVCPDCGSKMTGTVEKGIDTAIATDMINLAWEGAWQAAVLVSSDHDFIPVVECLTTRGLRVINAHFPPSGMHLARKCWASIDLRRHLAAMKRS